MIRLTDGNKTVEITMKLWKDGQYTSDWSIDFFEVGSLDWDEETDTYKVDDVDYCIDQAMDWKNGTGDFYDDEDDTDPEDKLVFVEEVD